MSNNARKTLRERAPKAIFQEAFLRVESAVVIALTAILAVVAASFGDSVATPLLIMLGGVIAEAAIIYSSISDSEFQRKVIDKLLLSDFHPERLNNEELQAQFTQALDYRSRIETAVNDTSDSLIKDELSQTASQIDEWLEHIYGLARRIDRYQSQKEQLPNQKRASSRIRKLERDLAQEKDAAIKEQIELTLDGLRRQIETLDNIEATIQRAELQLENSLTHLGTIYSQTVLVGAKDIDSSRARRLRQEINEEVVELQDMLTAMDEVYAAEAL